MARFGGRVLVLDSVLRGRGGFAEVSLSNTRSAQQSLAESFGYVLPVAAHMAQAPYNNQRQLDKTNC
eukprot:2106775-Amphidinium_carterae.1